MDPNALIWPMTIFGSLFVIAVLIYALVTFVHNLDVKRYERNTRDRRLGVATRLAKADNLQERVNVFNTRITTVEILAREIRDNQRRQIAKLRKRVRSLEEKR